MNDFLKNNTVTNALVLTGHGNSSAIGVIDGKEIITTANLYRAFAPILSNRGMASAQIPPAFIYLEGCNTGSGNSSIAQHLSEIVGPNTAVIAPVSPILGALGLRLGNKIFIGGVGR